MEHNPSQVPTSFAGVVNIKPVIRCNEPDRYLVEDIYSPDFTLSRTTLFAGKSTKGHQHQHEEVYYFISGQGRMTIAEEDVAVGPNMFIRIPGDAFHRVINEGSNSDLVFLCVWYEANDSYPVIENTIIEKIIAADFAWAKT